MYGEHRDDKNMRYQKEMASELGKRCAAVRPEATSSLSTRIHTYQAGTCSCLCGARCRLWEIAAVDEAMLAVCSMQYHSGSTSRASSSSRRECLELHPRPAAHLPASCYPIRGCGDGHASGQKEPRQRASPLTLQTPNLGPWWLKLHILVIIRTQ